MIVELFRVLNKNQLRNFYKIQGLVILMAFFEVFSIASIGPFMALVAEPNIIESNDLLRSLYSYLGFDNIKNFMFFSGFLILLTLIMASLVSIFTTWRLSIFAMNLGTEISDKLFKYYINQSWLFHTSASSAQLTKQITTESSRITHNIIMPFMILNSRLILAICIGLSLIFYDPKVAILGLLIFISGYFFIYKIVKRRLLENGSYLSLATAQRFRIINEGLGGIRDVILLNRSGHFLNKFEEAGFLQAKSQAINNTLSQAPRYFMELLAFGSMILLILVLIQFGDKSLSHILPLLAVYALSGLKLLPALQQIYSSITTIKGSIAAFEAIKNDLFALNEEKCKSFPKISKNEIDIDSAKSLILKNINFSYPSSSKLAINNVNIKIDLKTTIGFVGESGSGKSTLIDLIVGLIDPLQGELLLDEIKINNNNKLSWQSNIGFVSQSIFLSEGTVAENIAFGLNESEIDWNKIYRSIRLANLQDLIQSLPEGVHTKIGERGVKLSGGQRQRIGIARALYTNAKILVFDEATSALDGVTERKIMNAINSMRGERTIIMIAHRFKTIINCDQIFLMDKGAIIDSGTFIELQEKNINFKEMNKSA